MAKKNMTVAEIEQKMLQLQEELAEAKKKEKAARVDLAECVATLAGNAILGAVGIEKFIWIDTDKLVKFAASHRDELAALCTVDPTTDIARRKLQVTKDAKTIAKAVSAAAKLPDGK